MVNERKDTPFFKECFKLKSGQAITRNTLTFWELFNLKYPANYPEELELRFFWGKLKIEAETKEDIEMNVWSGKQPVDENISKHICKKGSKVLVTMASRMGDIGITDNLTNPNGYNTRVDISVLESFEITKF